MSAVLKPKNSKPVRERVSREEWQMRVDLAAAYQLAAIFKWTDLIYTHFSARVPGTEDFLINPYGLMFDEITASNLVRIDAAGKVIDDPLDLGYNEAGFVIHGCVHAARPEINCVIHTHTRAGVAVSAMKCGLLPISQHAMRFYGEMKYHDFKGFEFDHDMTPRLLEDLDGGCYALLRNHGALVCGDSVAECVTNHHWLEMACQAQIAALSAGYENLLVPDTEACEYAHQQFMDAGSFLKGTKDWDACLRLADRLDPGYKE